MAEFIVALGIGATTAGVRDGWAPYDLETEDGTKVEVKSSSYIQSWAQKKLSHITYSIAPTRVWDPDTNAYTGDVKRQADVYVFALLAPRVGSGVAPLELDQWVFYVLSTAELDRRLGHQKTVTLSKLQEFTAATGFIAELSSAFQHAKQRMG